MYKLFNETLLTDMGRTKVRKHLKTTGVETAWKEYSEYVTTASKGASEKRELTHCDHSTLLDSQIQWNLATVCPTLQYTIQEIG